MPGPGTTYLFEASWEVCNKVGGIHTVIRSKLSRATAEFGDGYFLVGPLLPRNVEFEETDEPGWRIIREQLSVKELKFRLGRWAVPERPKVILVEPAGRYNTEQLLFRLWERFGVDSIAGGWDYIEPVLYSTAFGETIATIANYLVTQNGHRILAHFHEWMTGAGLLHVRDKAPHVATVFTTHATVVGRAMMGGGQEIYANLDEISPSDEARSHNVAAKHSMECVAARQADSFTTVSEITAREAYRVLGRESTVVTPNGINIEAITDLSADRTPALASRAQVLDYARRFLGVDIPENARLAMISGRYEFTNKGIDVFLEALARVRDAQAAPCPLLAFLFVVGAHLEHRPETGQAGRPAICSHRLPDENNDPILTNCIRFGLTNQAEQPIKVIFIPVYLSEGDGVLNMSYYDVLQGFDLGVFPSKYEPWGYTPLESAAYAVPTVTTDQAGFGIWARHYVDGDEAPGIFVVPRMGRPREEVVSHLAEILTRLCSCEASDLERNRQAARRIAEKASWDVFYDHYVEAYDAASVSAEKRVFREAAIRTGQVGRVLQATESGQPHFRSFVVETEIPAPIARLREIAYNLWWSWTPPAQELFERIDPHLWEESGHNPIRVLDDVSAARLAELAASETYLRLYAQVTAALDKYLAVEGPTSDRLEKTSRIGWRHPVAYFSTEFGLHESLPIYSGGLGVLSGDHLKSASDLGVPLVGVGLFYKHGYFTQRIDSEGRQAAEYVENDPATLPMKQVRDDSGAAVTIAVDLPGRTLYARIWRVEVGRTPLYLLDADLPANTAQDRLITAQLYVGDQRTRIEQEILLGIGGARALRRVGITPSLYHLNEGHSAFLIIESIRQAMREADMSFDEAREMVRSQIVFTTHTPVEAGNERFPHDLVRHYFAHYFKELGISPDRFFELGRLGTGDNQSFIMTILALKCAYLSNGVSRLHGSVSRKMWESVWQGVPRSMVPIEAITNGIHAPTFIGPELRGLLDTYLGLDWTTDDLSSTAFWDRLDTLPDDLLWSVKIEMKQRLIAFVKERLAETWAGDGAGSEVTLEEVLSRVHSSALTIGFARRFAPYKRATLLFQDLERLARIVNNPRRPVQFIFAGKAHPNDQAGCDLVAEVVRYARDSRFAGRIIFLENYDLLTAKLLVQGVDVWLNTPRRPHEASGTSGQKAGVNGGINLSVADGWWCEGATGDNGWTIGPAPDEVDEDTESNDFQDALHLLALLEDVVVPLFYRRNSHGVPDAWLRVVRRSIATVTAGFNSLRMLTDYWNQAYLPAAVRGDRMRRDGGAKARELAAWKKKAAARFGSVQILDIRTSGLVDGAIQVGRPFRVSVRVDLGEMKAEELCIELIVGQSDPKRKVRDPVLIPLRPEKKKEKERTVSFRGAFKAERKGNYAYGIRLMPYHPDLGHKEEMGLVVWA